MAGDLINHIDGEQTQGLTLNQAVDKMRGQIGSSVNLTLVRGESKQKVEVKTPATGSRSRAVAFRSRKQRHRLYSRYAVQRADLRRSQEGDREIQPGSARRQAQGLHHRPAQQSGGLLGPIGGCVERLP